MSRESEKLYDGITNLSDGIVEAAQVPRPKRRRLYRKWMGPMAAILALAVLVSALFGSRLLSSAYAVEEPVYPKYKIKSGFSADDGVRSFVSAALPVFLSGEAGKNRVCAPLNAYLALAMTAELTAGESRAQILSALGEKDVETVREQARELWKQNYLDFEGGNSLLATSLWLDDDVPYERETLRLLAENYYASSYSGKMGSRGLDRALQSWLNKQTGGMLSGKAAKESTRSWTEEDLLTLASTVYFRGKWSAKFEKSDTAKQLFHGPSGDTACDFMNQRMKGTYYWFDSFSVVSKSFTSDAAMWFFLPDEGMTPEELLRDPQLLGFLTSEKWHYEEYGDNSAYLYINLSVPKFDIAGDVEMKESLQALGVTDIFDLTASDFTPLTRDEALLEKGICLSEARQTARVLIDETGCEAAAYIKFQYGAGAGAPPTEEIDFVLDRPFLFAVTNGANGLPLFVGIVNDP